MCSTIIDVLFLVNNFLLILAEHLEFSRRLYKSEEFSIGIKILSEHLQYF